jgi:Tfp pilus assembly protein PilF
MAETYVRRQQNAAAITAYEKALAVDPKGRWSGRARAGLKHILKKQDS